VIGVDVVESKLALAGRFGADIVLHGRKENVSRKVANLTDGYGADMALECSGHPDSMKAAVECVHGQSTYESGTLVGVAAFTGEVLLDRARLFREGAFMRSGDHTRRELREVIELVGKGRFDMQLSVSHRFDFSELEHALESLEHRREDIIRAVLTIS
jgi:propanol-preferring alcohol dehydrogenase